MSPERTDALLKARLAEQGVGLVALQVDKGSVAIAVQGSAGDGQPLGEDARFEIGSITKTFTALLLADAVVRRRFALDDPVESALPPGLKLRDAADAPIRWVDLATHRSGLPRLPTNLAPQDRRDPYAGYDEAQLLRFLRDFKPTAARDTRWEYSNLGFGLLGYALGRAAGSSYAAAARRAGARAPGHEPFRPRPAGADDPRPGRRPRCRRSGACPTGTSTCSPAPAALVMPAADLARYAQAALRARQHAARRGVPPGAAAPCAPERPRSTPMGLGWVRVPLNGRILLQP